jgi:hypothetical protein
MGGGGMGGGGMGGGGMGGGGMGGGGMGLGGEYVDMGSPAQIPPPMRMQSAPGAMVGGGSPGGFGGGGGPPDMNDPSSLKTPRDGSGLYNMLEALTGGNLDFELPLAALQEVTKHVATISRKAAPKLIQQKRAFVRGWHEENRKLNQPGGGGLRRQHSADGAVSAAPKMKQDPEDVYREVDARLAAAQRSITQSELAEHHVDALSEAIAGLLNISLPTMMRDRRSLILSWHAQQQRMRGGGGRGGGPGTRPFN